MSAPAPATRRPAFPPPHGTPINRTDDFRRAVQYHYRPADTVQVDDAVRLAAFGSEGRNVTC